MDFILDVFKQTASLLISIGVLAVLSFVLREWIKRFLDHYYKSREAKTTLDNQIQLEFIKQRVPMSMEFTQIVYKARNCARQILNKHTSLVPEKEDFLQCSSLLTERLYMYRILLDEDIFAMLHDFKRACQDFLMFLDVSDRPENLQIGKYLFSEDLEKKLNNLFLQIDDLYLKIAAYFQTKYKLYLRE